MVLPGAPAPDAARQIVVTIAAFGPDGDGAITLKAEWTVLGGEPPKPVLRRDVDLQTGSGRGGAAVAQAMSGLLGQLADRMASTLAQTGGPAQKGG